MECGDLCPYNGNVTFQFSNPVNLLSESAAKSIILTKLIDESSGLHEGIMSDHRVKVQYTSDNFIEIIEKKLSEGEKVLGYWYCPMEQKAVIVYEIPLSKLMKLSETLGCKYKSLNLDCSEASPLSSEELDLVEVGQQISDDSYEGKYKQRRLRIRHLTLRGPSHQEEKILHEIKKDTKEEYDRIRISNFRRELCFQAKASKINLGLRIYGYWLCENSKKGIFIQDDIRGNELRDFISKNPNDKRLIEVYILIIYAILTQTLELRISHNGLRKLDGSLVRSNIILHGKKGQIPSVKFIDYSKATECPNDISLMKTFSLNRQIHLGPRLNTTTAIDLNSETLAHYFFEDLVDFNKLVLTFINDGLSSGKIKQGDIADKIRISITANKFENLDTWLQIYRKLIRGKLPSPNDVLGEVSARFQSKLPKK